MLVVRDYTVYSTQTTLPVIGEAECVAKKNHLGSMEKEKFYEIRVALTNI